MATPPPAPAKSGWLNARWHNIPHWALVGGAGALIIGIYVLKKRAAAASSSTVGGAGGTLPSDLSGYGYGAGGAPGGIGGGIGTPTGVGLPAGGLITGSIPPSQPPTQQAATPATGPGSLGAPIIWGGGSEFDQRAMVAAGVPAGIAPPGTFNRNTNLYTPVPGGPSISTAGGTGPGFWNPLLGTYQATPFDPSATGPGHYIGSTPMLGSGSALVAHQ